VARYKQGLLSIALSLAIALFCYGGSIDSFFLADDFDHLLAVKDRGPWALGLPGNAFFRPAISASMYLTYLLARFDPVPYHITNLAIHVANSVLVALVSWQLIASIEGDRRLKPAIAYLSGLTFLVLPCHSESVAWIAGRSDLIATFFAIAAFSVYLYNFEKIEFACLSLLLFSLALLSKESAIIYPEIIFFHQLHLYFSDRRTTIKKIIFIPLIHQAIFLAYWLLRSQQLGTTVGGYGEDVHLEFDIVSAAINLIRFAARTFLPPVDNVPPGFWLFVFILETILLVAALTICLRRRRQATATTLVFLIASFLVSLVPIINLGISTINTRRERYLYLPSVFMSIAVCLALSLLLPKLKPLVLSMAIAIVFWSISLSHLDGNWATAGRISQSVIQSLDGLAGRDRVFIASLPDRYRGAHIYRIGFHSAYHLFYGENIPPHLYPKLKIVRVNTVLQPQDTTIARQTGPRTYRVSPSNPKTTWTQFPPDLNDPSLSAYTTRDRLGKSYEISFDRWGENDVLLYYHDMGLTMVEESLETP